LSPPQILVFGFAALIFTGAVLLSMPFASASGQSTNFLVSLFTSTSAVCVTGLVVVDTGTYWSTTGQAIILCLIQLGGLGFMTMAIFIFLLLGKKIGLKTRLIMQASLNQNHIQGIVNLGKYVLLFTFFTELFFAAILTYHWSHEMELGKAVWYGVFHTVSGFNNAGFDLFGGFKSLTGYARDFTVNICISLLIILGGIGFSVVMDLLNYRHSKKLTVHTKVVLIVTSGLILAGTVLIYVFEYNNVLRPLDGPGKLLASYFQAVTPRTAGYNTLDLASMHSYTQMLIIILMFIGASPGSTGGGIKTTTFAVLGFSMLSLYRGQMDVTLFRRRIPSEQVAKSLAILLLALGLIIINSIALMITERQDNFLMTLFETVSAFGTVGLSLGLTPSLSDPGKIIIITTMFLGRVGTMTAIMAFSQHYKTTAKICYPSGNLLIG
jgi:trk system potassium uptake protein TrkH